MGVAEVSEAEPDLPVDPSSEIDSPISHVFLPPETGGPTISEE